MNIFMRFSEGKAKALTLSYDDGVIQDKRLIDILKPHGIKATFNINSGLFADKDVIDSGRMSLEQAKKLYINSGHEIAIHSVTHPFLERLPLPIAIDKVLQDRKNLEKIFGGVIRGMAYPFGTYSDSLIEALKNMGIAYSRTVISTHDFRIPIDWLRLTATCHHKDSVLPELTEKFIKTNPNSERFNRQPLLFYLWGHSYEFDNDNNWNVIEEFAQKIGNSEDIWYATNIEIYDYIEAYNNLKFSVNGNTVYNPSAKTIWFEKNGVLHKIESNKVQTISLEE